ncbi:hypothetical protein NQZ79_g513 [Umbelopsis isabellina]|nr:hypothetical protein NQZ79_g513 [Umbelopsis isabellina]
MREPNFSLPAQNRAAVVITSTLYDRRALDCTALLPLINSLTHLTYMTSTSPRIREILVLDGGLERLVRILQSAGSIKPGDRKSMWKWSLAFQCVVNVGVRGSEQIRTRVVQAGMIPIIVAVLDNFFKTMEQVKLEKEKEKGRIQLQQVTSTNEQSSSSNEPDSLSLHPSHTRSTPVNPSRTLFPPLPERRPTPVEPNDQTPRPQPTSPLRPISTATFTGSTAPPDVYPVDRPIREYMAADNMREDVSIIWGEARSIQTHLPRRTTLPLRRTASSSLASNNNTSSQAANAMSLSEALSADATLHREEDILLSLQLLAYISKYPHLRIYFHEHTPCNVFSLVEKFTHRLHPPAIQYWAGVIMRNACRKDETRGGVRQCAFMQCGRWERYPREFAKCRRCRKAKYCSKQCQSKAWSEGHRWWCVERSHTNSNFNAHPSTGISTPVEEPSQNRIVTEPVIAINSHIGMERANTPAVTAEPPDNADTGPATTPTNEPDIRHGPFITQRQQSEGFVISHQTGDQNVERRGSMDMDVRD